MKITMSGTAGPKSSATLVRWYKTAGVSVAKGDILARLETEDSFIDLESALAGTMGNILVPAGETVNPGDILAELDNDKLPLARNEGKKSMTAKHNNPTPPGNVVSIVLPQVGNDMEEGTIVKWEVAEGDTIEVGQVLFEVETDKATIEIESDHAGRLAKIVVPEGESVPIKTPVAYLGDNDTDVEAYIESLAIDEAPTSQENTAKTPAPAKAADVPSTAMPTDAPVASERLGLKASPAARKLAGQRGVDLAALSPGSGPGGRIVSRDIPAAASKTPPPAAAAVAPAPVVTAPAGEPTRTKLAGMRKAIARNLTASKQNIPHFYMKLNVNAEAMMAFYRVQKNQYKLSVNDVVLLACGRTMHEFSAFRSRLEGEEIIELPTANIGIAVGVDNGLVVPVIQGVDRMTLEQLAGESRRIVESARNGKVENMGTGSFTITNLGMFGVSEFSAIINPPEAGILAVGGVREDVIVSDGAIRPSKVLTVTLSCDHRVVDGLEAAKFLARLKELLENPNVMV